MQAQTTENHPSLDDIRSRFPALEREHNGFPVAYFDGPGGTQVPREVVEAMSDYLFNHNANTHWGYPTSDETDEMIADSRAAFADFFNCSPDEVVFGQNMTTITFHLARALGRQFSAGDEIVVTELDHHANVDTWRSLETDRGVIIRVLPMDTESGQLMLDELPGLLNERTKLVAIGAASNAIGTISDIRAACATARKAGALTFVDAVHFAPHNLVDVRGIGCDFLACSAYKFYGPHIGILFGRKELIETIDFPKLRPAPNHRPDRAETGTQSHESIVGAAAAVDFIASLGMGETRRERLRDAFDFLHGKDAELVQTLWSGLSEIPGVRVYGPPTDCERTSLVSFTVGDHRSEEVSRFLAERGMFVSHGDFYASTVVERYGITEQGLVRVGCSFYTTENEVQRLIAGVAEFVAAAG
ncbi:MAG: cysteine desulfurase-like protein [Pyrinomonadaceae bacterium]|nr:cysteine desulfurase-like protein [Pyrinomonadaceae bacterium]